MPPFGPDRTEGPGALSPSDWVLMVPHAGGQHQYMVKGYAQAEDPEST